ncbi:ABC transporter ATP-binding protein [Clostridium puniceum]|nr:ABC transporter ATP-binding protein [Clostridium puniceum]
MLSEYLNKYISKVTLEKIAELDLIQFDDAKIYDDIQKVNDESVSRSMEFMNMLIQLIKSVVSLLGTATIFLTYNPLIIILCVCTTIPMFCISVKVSTKEFSLFNERLEKRRFVMHLRSIFITNENIKEMKIFGVGKYFKKLILDIYQQYIDEDKVIRKRFLRNYTLAFSLENILSYGIKLYSIVSSIKNKFSIGSITMFISGIESIQSSIAIVLNVISELYENKLYMQSLFSILELKPKYNKEHTKKMPFNKNFKTIEFKNVWFKYPNREDYALKNINLKIEAKKTYSLVGMNGSGKTTLIKLLSMLYLPNKGNIYIDGIDINEYDRLSIYENIAVVFQDFVRYPLEVYKNIGIGSIENIENMDKIKEAAAKSGAVAFIEKLPKEYKTQLQKEWTSGVDLSLGQWQKLAISRAFMADRSMLILDEPTASLDAATEYEIFKSFNKMVEGKTCILISHRFSTVKIANEIFVIKDGEIIEKGSHKELIKNDGLYAELYGMQSECYV